VAVRGKIINGGEDLFRVRTGFLNNVIYDIARLKPGVLKRELVLSEVNIVLRCIALP
jgi:hypothetical protein